MNININQNSKYTFDELDAGDVFLFKDEVYMKLKDKYYVSNYSCYTDYLINAIGLGSQEFQYIDHNAFVDACEANLNLRTL
jgi:hypothetical protein